MSIATTLDAMQAIHAAITGVTSAPTTYPGSINTAQMPLVLTWPGPGTSHQEAMNSLRRQDRIYIVRVYLDTINQGRGKDEVWQTGEILLQRFIEAYINPDNIALTSSPHATLKISSENPVQDTGLIVLSYPPGAGESGTPCYGFELRVGVFEKW